MLPEQGPDNKGYFTAFYWLLLNRIWVIDSGEINVIIGRSLVIEPSETFLHNVTLPLRGKLLLYNPPDLDGCFKWFTDCREDIVSEIRNGVRNSNRRTPIAELTVAAHLALVCLPAGYYIRHNPQFKDLMDYFIRSYPQQRAQLENDLQYITEIEDRWILN